LKDAFTAYTDFCKEDRKKTYGAAAVFPCKLSIIKCFRNKNPVIMGVNCTQGVLKLGTPLIVEDGKGGFVRIGKVESM
jgi:translation initiation factor 5B